MLLMSEVNSTTASEKSSWVVVIRASNDLKLPSTSETNKWVTLNPSLECALSSDQVFVWPNVATAIMTAMNDNLIFFIVFDLVCIDLKFQFWLPLNSFLLFFPAGACIFGVFSYFCILKGKRILAVQTRGHLQLPWLPGGNYH